MLSLLAKRALGVCLWSVMRFTVPVELGGHVPADGPGVCDAAGAGGAIYAAFDVSAVLGNKRVGMCRLVVYLLYFQHCS